MHFSETSNTLTKVYFQVFLSLLIIEVFPYKSMSFISKTSWRNRIWVNLWEIKHKSEYLDTFCRVCLTSIIPFCVFFLVQKKSCAHFLFLRGNVKCFLNSNFLMHLHTNGLSQIHKYHMNIFHLYYFGPWLTLFSTQQDIKLSGVFGLLQCC